jgi:hypothetical protein
MIGMLTQRVLELALVKIGHEVGIDHAIAILQAEHDLAVKKITAAGLVPKERHLRLVR